MKRTINSDYEFETNPNPKTPEINRQQQIMNWMEDLALALHLHDFDEPLRLHRSRLDFALKFTVIVFRAMGSAVNWNTNVGYKHNVLAPMNDKMLKEPSV